ncbi:D-alanine--D-alanine ligase [Leifsonia sp. H3M29-4]|uniref:D-alanine--D-alanine ligase family protein n=1 Tax=Salinibacterium metalliresistens TaxID=3031321 RepID=UPI0023DB29CC|nr:D-alanine--D-alanine ligase [Salinibacterium metalliresistens]MDF1477791.1 D-alanine--D-alanine ligase [Salinibacterium metalliresistens]
MSGLRVAVIGGGENCEHDVSLASAASVGGVLAEQGMEVVGLTIDRDGSWRDAADAPLTLPAAIAVLQSCQVAFPLVHGPRGEDGSLAALLEFARVPAVGSGVAAGAIAMEKWATKLVANSVGVATAGATMVRAGDPLPAVTLPVVVKPVAAGSSFGVAVVERPDELAPAIAAALRLDDRVLVETFVTGREVDVAVLELPDGSRRLGAPLEIVPTGRIFDTERKYGGHPEFLVPAPLTEGERRALERAALAVFDEIGCAGLARIDFFLTPDGPVLNEVNTTPGMTAHSQVPRMFEAVGLGYPQLLVTLLETALAA